MAIFSALNLSAPVRSRRVAGFFSAGVKDAVMMDHYKPRSDVSQFSVIHLPLICRSKCEVTIYRAGETLILLVFIRGLFPYPLFSLSFPGQNRMNYL